MRAASSSCSLSLWRVTQKAAFGTRGVGVGDETL